jgi:hypothetical protein
VNNTTLIDGHVLIPHEAEWSEPPSIQKRNRGDVSASLLGLEDRKSFGEGPWIELRYIIQPFDHVERARLADRLRAARKLGAAAVPYWSKGVKYSGVAGANLTVAIAGHGFTAGQFVFVQHPDPARYDTWDAREILSVAGAVLTLASAPTNSYPTSAWVRPLLFGKPTPDTFPMLNRNRGRFPVAILAAAE